MGLAGLRSLSAGPLHRLRWRVALGSPSLCLKWLVLWEPFLPAPCHSPECRAQGSTHLATVGTAKPWT